MSNLRAWKTCEECGKKTRRIYKFKNVYYCWICSLKHKHIMPWKKEND